MSTEVEEELAGEFRARFKAHLLDADMVESLVDDAMDLVVSEGLLEDRV